MSCRIEFCHSESLPEKRDGNQDAGGRSDEFDGPQDAARGLGQLQVVGQPAPEHAKPISAANEHPDRTPCVTNVRGSSVGVSEAAKKSVPISRPAAEKERQNLKIQNSLIGAATCDHWSASRQLAVQDTSAQPATARNHGDATNSIPIWSSLCSGAVFPNFRGAVARRSPRVSKETEQRGTMAELHRLWRLETEFGTERPQLTKRKDNKRLL